MNHQKTLSMDALSKARTILGCNIASTTTGASFFRSQNTKSTLAEFVVVVFEPCGRVFTEIASEFIRVMKEAGFRCSQSLSQTIFAKDNIYVLFNAHQDGIHFEWHRANYIVFNYEQLRNVVAGSVRYRNRLRHALAVFDYSNLNAQYWISCGVSRTNVHVLPFGLPSSFVRSAEHTTPNKNKTTDVLFYGSAHPRRLKVLQELASRGLSVRFVSECFGTTLTDEIRNARIVANIHYFTEPSVLEAVRIVRALSEHAQVVSEHSDDQALDKLFDPFVHWADINTFSTICIALLSESVKPKVPTTTEFEAVSYTKLFEESTIPHYLQQNCVL